jgi:hypothetical protein
MHSDEQHAMSSQGAKCIDRDGGITENVLQ